MGVHRYLMYASYIGTPFRGAQRQLPGSFPRVNDPSTVQGCLEMGLKQLNPSSDPVVILSSRTDAGVHAINSAFHFDLYRCGDTVIEPQTITVCLNRLFNKESIPIRLNKTFLVDDNFDCRRNAISRTYLYRLCLLKSDRLNTACHTDFIPITEWERILILCTDTFDVEEIVKASRLFVGCYDFRTFMSRGSHYPDLMTRREILSFDITPGNLSIFGDVSWPGDIGVRSRDDYQVYNFLVKGTGFVYRQVRRMVASLIAVAQGKITSRDIKLMLQVPSQRSWNERIKTVPGYGLYLCQVDYSDKDKGTFKESVVN